MIMEPSQSPMGLEMNDQSNYEMKFLYNKMTMPYIASPRSFGPTLPAQNPARPKAPPSRRNVPLLPGMMARGGGSRLWDERSRRQMREGTLDQSVVVSDQSFASTEPFDIVSSNIEFVNALFGEHLRADEIAPDGLRSYYVDYYLAQVNNGGFSQFVYNSHWSLLMNGFIREGLAAIKAQGHLALFDESAALVEHLGGDRLQTFLESEYFGTNAERDALDANNDRFYDLSEAEDLLA